MPELPDITIYIEALERRILHQSLLRIQVNSLFLLRSATPPIETLEGEKVIQLRRIGKRICFGFERDLWLVLHLMIAGRLHWKDVASAPARATGKAKFAAPPKNRLAVFHFENGQLSLTEAGTQRRASLHIVQGEDALRALDRGGVELFGGRAASRSEQQPSASSSDSEAFIDLASFTRVLKSENHTLKRGSPIRGSSVASATHIQTKSFGRRNCRPSNSPKS